MAADPSLIDRVVIVTGGSRGLGAEMALALVEAGARVAVVGLNDSPHLAQTVKEAEAVAGSGRLIPIVADVRRDADCQRVAAETLQGLRRDPCAVQQCRARHPGRSRTYQQEAAHHVLGNPPRSLVRACRHQRARRVSDGARGRADDDRAEVRQDHQRVDQPAYHAAARRLVLWRRQGVRRDRLAGVGARSSKAPA